MTIIQSEGPLKLRRTEKVIGRATFFEYSLWCTECGSRAHFAHRVDAEDAFDAHDHSR